MPLQQCLRASTNGVFGHITSPLSTSGTPSQYSQLTAEPIETDFLLQQQVYRAGIAVIGFGLSNRGQQHLFLLHEVPRR